MSHLHGLEVPPKEVVRKESQRDRDRQAQFVGLSKKSNSTSQLSATGKLFYFFILFYFLSTLLFYLL